MSTMILHTIHTFRLKYFIYKSTRKQGLGLQSTDFMSYIFINNLQHFKCFHHQSTSKIWTKSTIYKKGTPPPYMCIKNGPTELFENLLVLETVILTLTRT